MTQVIIRIIDYVVTPVRQRVRARRRPARWDEYFNLNQQYVNNYPKLTDEQRTALQKRINKLRKKVVSKDSVANA